MAYKQSPINFGVGTGSSPLNKTIASKEDIAKDQGHELKDAKKPEENNKKTKLSLRDRITNRRIKRNIEKGDLVKAGDIATKNAERKRRKGKGKTKVAPTSIPINDPSMKNYNEAVDARTNKSDAKKEDTKKEHKNYTERTGKQTKRGTGKTYEDVWATASDEYKAKYGGDKAKAIAAMKAWNKKQDAKKKKPSPYSTSTAVKENKNKQK